jgi:hypothetical protein
MIISTKKIILWILLLFVSWFIYSVLAQTIEQGSLTLQIQGLGIRHGTPENFTLWTITSSLGNQYISGHFADHFRVEDIEGYITGHYTTIQCAGVYGPYNYILTWIELMAGNTTPELIMGYTWPNVYINSALNTYTSIIEPITYIYKSTNISNASLVNRYGDKPWLKILIPPTAPAGIYSGTIVFSFYME